MVRFVFTPEWFTGADICIEVFSFIILATFFILSYRSYKLGKNKSAILLGVGFLLISLAELANIFTKLVMYYDVFYSQQIGQMVVTYKVVKSVDVFYKLGFFFHKLLTLAGFYFIYSITLKRINKKDALLMLYFFAIIAAVSLDVFYYFFHTTAFLILMYIIINYSRVYEKNKSTNTKVLVISFSLLALSQAMYVLSKLAIMDVTAQIVQLVSYLILLILIVRIIKYGSKNNGQELGTRSSEELLKRYGRSEKKQK